MIKQYQSSTQMSVSFWVGVACEETKTWRVVFSVKKKAHKALRPVQFLASFISFYFETLSYLGEKIIRLASKNSVKLR